MTTLPRCLLFTPSLSKPYPAKTRAVLGWAGLSHFCNIVQIPYLWAMALTTQDLDAMKARIAAGKATTAANRKALANGPKPKPQPAQQVARIGIDPAFRKNGLGVCVIFPNGEVTFPRFKGRGMVGFVQWLYNQAPESAAVVVENANAQNASFDTSGSRAVAIRKGRNVGANQAISETIVDFCIDRWGKDAVQSLSPRQKGAKWAKETFVRAAEAQGHQLPIKYRQDDIDAYQLALRAASATQ